jgi:diguanylate cyclase (GGDEF)-like protein
MASPWPIRALDKSIGGPVISIRQKIDEHERFAQSFQALLNVFHGLAAAIPKAALPASPELWEQCRSELRRAADRLKSAPSRQEIDEAGATTLHQIDDICRSNQHAIEERDAALKDVVATVAGAVSGLKGRGERRESSLSRLADDFASLSNIGDAAELRRELRHRVTELRQSVEDMRVENEGALRSLESEVRVFEQRLEAARRGSSKDRLTGVGSRREAEKVLQGLTGAVKPVSVLLFDIEGFGEINARYGTPFGDKLLQALVHTLRGHFPENDALFRWGADEFLIIAEAPLPRAQERCRMICAEFARGLYTTFEGGSRTSVGAHLAGGVAQYTKGEATDELYRRARATLERSRLCRSR